MAAAARAPVWIVLEYLSAEPWIDASHGLPSPHPRYPLTRTFWFPGFTPRSGGLLREAGLLAQRDLPLPDMLDRYEQYIYRQWLRVYLRSRTIKHNKDLFWCVGDTFALLDKLHIY